MRLLILVAIASLTATASEAAGYMLNRGDWDRQSTDEKGAYVMGVVDASAMLYTTDTKAEVDYKLARVKCLRDQRLDNHALARLVDERYAADTARWREPPSALVLQVVFQVCPMD